MHTILGRKSEGKNHSEDLGGDGEIIIEWIIGWESVDWIHLAQDRDQWRCLVNMVKNLCIP
jgi:hypothetical protein